MGIKATVTDCDNASALKTDSAKCGNFLEALNPCAKLTSLIVFLLCVVSFKKYEFSALLPYLALPLLGAAFLKIGFLEMFLKSLPALFLAAMAGIANLFLDTQCAFKIFSLPISYGMLSFLSLILKAYLCVGAAIIFAKCTSPNDIAAALGKLKVPCILVLQLMLTARYLETIANEAFKISRAYAIRSPQHPQIKFSHFPHILLSLLLRSVDRAGRIFKAMQCRGFSARLYKTKKMPYKICDAIFFAAFTTLCLAFRFFNLPQILEKVFQ